MKHQNILVLGGTGFVGSHLIARLAAEGRRVLVPTRRRERGRHLILLPTVDVVEANIHDADVLRQLLRGQDAVINLVGILQSDRATPYGKAFRRAHVELPRALVAACADTNVRRLLHMSALGAAPDATSMYLRSKGDGEAIVLAAPGVATTAFRPSVIFGPGDSFLTLFAKMQKWLPVIPLACARARFQPVHVDDVVTAMAKALDQPLTFGRAIEVTGPQVYTLRELVALAGRASGHPRPILALPHFLGRLQAGLMELLPGALLSRDNLDSMKTDNVAQHAPERELARLLGIEAPKSPEMIAPEYLSGESLQSRYDLYRRHSHR